MSRAVLSLAPKTPVQGPMLLQSGTPSPNEGKVTPQESTRRQKMSGRLVFTKKNGGGAGLKNFMVVLPDIGGGDYTI